MGFYKNFAIGFAIQLIILLAIMAVVLSNKSKNQTFPAELATCPDFYRQTVPGRCEMVPSVYSSRDPGCVTLYPKNISHEEKKIWAAGCGVAWDGITNSSII